MKYIKTNFSIQTKPMIETFDRTPSNVQIDNKQMKRRGGQGGNKSSTKIQLG